MGFASWQHYCTASTSGRQPKFGSLNRGRHLCSAGRPSGWALAHILVLLSFFFMVALCNRETIYIFMLWFVLPSSFFFQAEDGIRDAQESRGLGDVYKRQVYFRLSIHALVAEIWPCLLYTSDAADE